eukprot:TRINITY_DN8273_c0_g1_i4.p1 TRINITY_DN8273_c0_g1~~TRINITY_DN8273_c0_g1_i4.p1  ORF type:complete len:183 (+),score=18.07 TRINITY_DN8273_c0_g1_i4:144-692(+)
MIRMVTGSMESSRILAMKGSGFPQPQPTGRKKSRRRRRQQGQQSQALDSLDAFMGSLNLGPSIQLPPPQPFPQPRPQPQPQQQPPGLIIIPPPSPPPALALPPQVINQQQQSPSDSTNFFARINEYGNPNPSNHTCKLCDGNLRKFRLFTSNTYCNACTQNIASPQAYVCFVCQIITCTRCT